MTTTPLMSLVLPTEGGSADVWAPILATVFGLIDGHDHTPGKGGKVPSAGLNINADVSWSSGGTSRAITDLRAIDFSAQPAAGMTALAGALFLSDGTGGLAANELYYRTTGGTNVRVTSGSALNVAGFTGGIGGDYSTAGALVDFDDATDSYRFRQQVGSSVRQFARMQSADVDLFEYKAHPAAGVPANRVRLASPAALAASYTLTLPAALPSIIRLLSVSPTGAVELRNDVEVVCVSPAGMKATGASITPSQITNGFFEVQAVAGAQVSVDVRVPVGKVITTIRFHSNSATNPLNAQLISTSSTGTVTGLITTANAPAGGNQTTAASGTVTVLANTTYTIVVARASGGALFTCYGIEYEFRNQ